MIELCDGGYFFFVPSLRSSPLVFTLFPYTTLFRSCFDLESHTVVCPLQPMPVRTTTTQILHEKFALSSSSPASDRKSTRLNSSHVSISYAVFCLKKKTNTGQKQHPRYSKHTTRPPR